MRKPIPIFRGSSGINTKLDPTRLRFNVESGISELAACVNCDIDDTGRVIRREGSTATDRTEAWKNLFGCGAYALGTKGNALCVLKADMKNYTAIRNITEGANMSYIRTSDGKQDVIFYCNEHETGLVKNKISYSWPLITPVGAVTIKEFYPAPIGHLLSIRNGRMFIAVDNILYYSEPNTYYAYRLAANYFAFSSRLKMVEAVTGGLWVSDEEGVYFLGGEIAPTLKEMPLQVKLAECPVIEGTAVKVPASRIGIDGLTGIVVVFTTTEGICVGSVDGQLINVTERKLDLPSGLTGAGFYKDGKYICTLD